MLCDGVTHFCENTLCLPRLRSNFMVLQGCLQSCRDICRRGSENLTFQNAHAVDTPQDSLGLSFGSLNIGFLHRWQLTRGSIALLRSEQRFRRFSGNANVVESSFRSITVSQLLCKLHVGRDGATYDSRMELAFLNPQSCSSDKP